MHNDARRSLYGASVEEIFGSAEVESLIPSVAKKQRKKNKNSVPDELMKLMGEANFLYAENRINEAIPLLKDIVKNRPEFPDPYLTLGNIYRNRKERRKAVKWLQLAAKYQRQKNPQLWRTIASLFKKIGDSEEAVEAYQKVIGLDPDDVESHFERCKLLEGMGDVNRAILGYLHLLSLQPTLSSAAFKVSELYHGTGKTIKAIEVLESVWSVMKEKKKKKKKKKKKYSALIPLLRP
eukprot:TRINITY_DN2482_c0_g2_i1.p1 TRINITY_DN2482_c0_g2~~TRINITY_DN2482_c0_g2_i1.p1  ORF type:complete len:237 (-),score=60.65 TRINITY_DN2482_c0_g2_i1:119-829(-)